MLISVRGRGAGPGAERSARVAAESSCKPACFNGFCNCCGSRFVLMLYTDVCVMYVGILFAVYGRLGNFSVVAPLRNGVIHLWS